MHVRRVGIVVRQLMHSARSAAWSTAWPMTGCSQSHMTKSVAFSYPALHLQGNRIWNEELLRLLTSPRLRGEVKNPRPFHMQYPCLYLGEEPCSPDERSDIRDCPRISPPA